MKQGMSSFDIAAMVSELQCIVGARIDKTYQPDSDQILLRLRVPQEGKKDLLIVLGKWIYLASESIETPKTPSSFAMLLRKHLSNGTITKIEQHGFDRIIVIHVQKEETFQLVCEQFREGNVVLVSKGTIIQPLFSKTWSHREVRAHREYVFPPSREDPREMDVTVLSKLLASSKKNLVRTLAVDVNLGGVYAEEVCLISEVDKGRKASGLSQDELNSVHEAMRLLFDALSSSSGGIIVRNGGLGMDITPIRLTGYGEYSNDSSTTLSGAIEVFRDMEMENEPEDIQFEEGKARIERQLAQQEQAVINLKKRAEEHKRRAELIYAHYSVCEGILDTIKTALKEKGIKETTEILGTVPEFGCLEPDKKTVTIKLKDEVGDEIQIELDYNKSVEENAGIYYDKAKRARDKLEGAERSVSETQRKLEGYQLEKEKSRSREKRRAKRFWFEKYKWFISSDGNIVIAGRDAKSNDRIVKKYLTDKDRYAHADVHGAPSVVVKGETGEITEQTMKEACQFAVAHSKAWNAKIGSGAAYWVMPDQVSKTPPAGEFLPRGAFMVYGKKNMVTNIEYRLAVGLIEYENIEILMCGPVDAIESQSDKYVVFEPGDMKKSDFSMRMRTIFHVEEEEVARILPPGDIRIMTAVGLPDNVLRK